MIFLSGWEDQSIWGWDPPTGSFFAQLWRNGSAQEDPEIWLTPDAKATYPWPSSVALAIVEKTNVDPSKVVAALGIADPNPQLVPDAEVMQLLQSAVDKQKTPLMRGAIHALGWAQGYAPATPTSRKPWPGVRPTPAQVDAEHHLATGYLYRPGVDREFYSGIDAALWWLLKRSTDTWFI